MTVTTDRPTPDGTAETGDGSHQVALAFEDGVTRFITCRDDQTVADASYRNRINIPLDCRDGACGTCKAFCESGDYDGGDYIEDALSQSESDEGYALPCSMKPKSDLVLQIAATSEVAKTQAATFDATIDDLQRLSETTVKLAVSIPNRGELAFLPGQYVNIAVPGTENESGDGPLTRSYSFSSGPHEDRLTFLIKITPGGVMSTYLTEQAKVGDSISFTGPHGSFFLRDSERPVMLLAGGTGLAPVLSILRKLHTDNSPRKAHLIYGVSTDEDLVAVDEIEFFEKELPGFTWDHCVSAEDSTAQNKGYVTTLIKPHHLYDGDVAIYLCGPPPMVESVRTHMSDTGIEPTGFYYEKFALAGAPPKEKAQGDATPDTTTAIAEAESGAARSTSGTSAGVADLLIVDEARGIGGQQVLPPVSTEPWTGPAARTADDDDRRAIAGNQIWRGSTAPAQVSDADGDEILPTTARGIGGQEVFAHTAIAPLHEPAPPAPSSPATAAAPAQPESSIVDGSTVGSQGYQIGQEHPGVYASDALFEARAALELGALEVTFGRMSSKQLAGYRLLADATLPYVDADKSTFIDAAEYTETNAAFHDYLFTQTRNEHLLQAYSALGVKGRMGEVLRNATWCHPLCAQDHVDIVDAFERGNKERAISLIRAHANRSKQTMRRAMADEMTARKPRFVTPGRFADKVVVVTGSAQGIGEHVARRIGAEGGKMVLADRSELVDELATELAIDGHATSVTADLETYAGAKSVVEHAVSKYGRIDVLINNVGGAINFKPFIEFTDAEIQAEIDRSLMTTLYASRAALPGMVERGQGTIVNVSSAATRGINRIPYSAAKGGINAITASLAVEYADAGIRVVATAPGGTEAPPRRISRGTPEATNEQEQAWFQAHVDQTLDSSLMHRYGTLDEQAAAVCFLASEEASYITGTVLPVAGGDLG
ncbi:1,6-dihydroxycyclohexa-2,4-diene-1-carboxylate dehydrogenase [Gordonia sp. HY002]|uniref:benzoate 1,2-dioxygenase electron transfer component BenC n=1 Tax=Gordonia zhenghanii TaxID=2911516 RepID=UPI001EF07F08|nr:benzoate 1,2-dioxygenase electron transfer component BenC [Gordonia zhenghanii]MCF8571022.1 1,6-dihydroxycyclohexa-2,4-diene-1-carboxylate dehydrogenase [Gordonia zhenghanii]MCF8607870.1 1,6-dihydroxycyclohexa-2,4-diene-1-carboxylate dehydrogenase [Gordonia zhenghanii]